MKNSTSYFQPTSAAHTSKQATATRVFERIVKKYNRQSNLTALEIMQAICIQFKNANQNAQSDPYYFFEENYCQIDMYTADEQFLFEGKVFFKEYVG